MPKEKEKVKIQKRADTLHLSKVSKEMDTCDFKNTHRWMD